MNRGRVTRAGAGAGLNRRWDTGPDGGSVVWGQRPRVRLTFSVCLFLLHPDGWHRGTWCLCQSATDRVLSHLGPSVSQTGPNDGGGWVADFVSPEITVRGGPSGAVAKWFGSAEAWRTGIRLQGLQRQFDRTGARLG